MSQLQSLYDIFNLAEVEQGFPGRLPFDPAQLIATDRTEPTSKVVIAFDYDEEHRVVRNVEEYPVVRNVPRPLGPCTHVLLIVFAEYGRAPVYASFGAQCQMELLQPNGVYGRAYPELEPLRQEVFGALEAQPAYRQPLHPSMRRHVPGEVFRDIRYFENCISLDVSPEQVKKALAAIEVFRKSPPPYQLISKTGLNCSSFVRRVIRQIDSDLPLITPWPALHARAIDSFCSNGQLHRVGKALIQPRAVTLEMQRTAMQICGLMPPEQAETATPNAGRPFRPLRLLRRSGRDSSEALSQPPRL